MFHKNKKEDIQKRYYCDFLKDNGAPEEYVCLIKDLSLEYIMAFVSGYIMAKRLDGFDIGIKREEILK